jgi:hypothetical protein
MAERGKRRQRPPPFEPILPTGESGIGNIIDGATAGSSFSESVGYTHAVPLAAFATPKADTEIRVAYNRSGAAATGPDQGRWCFAKRRCRHSLTRCRR